MCFWDMIRTAYQNLTGKKRKPTNYERFLARNVPIICVTGPPFCGKSTVSDMLRSCSKYALIKLDDLLGEEMRKTTVLGEKIAVRLKSDRRVPDRLVVNLLKREIVSSYVSVNGFIIDGFPENVTQAIYFKHRVVQPTVIVYATLNLDCLLARLIARRGPIDMNAARIRHVKGERKLNAVLYKFDPQTVKIHASYPPEHTVNHLVEYLEDNFGFKFTRISSN